MMKILKKMDLIIISLFLLFPLLMIFLQSSKDVKQVVIKLDGEDFAVYNVNVDRTIPVKSEYGENTVIIKNRSVYVTESSCNDKLEMKAGKINKVGESLVCLPNRLVVYMKGDWNTVANTY